MFESEDSRAAVTEYQIIAKTAEFLHGRAFEREAEAWSAAREFVEFCRGRMWVLSDAGTTADGEKLYAFTHRTFLEYFAGAHLAAAYDAPEDLAVALAPHVAAGQWEVVGELAIQIKDRNSDRGADRIYSTLLDLPMEPRNRSLLLEFLIRCLASARPSPITTRNLARAVIRFTGSAKHSHPFSALLAHSGNYEQLIAEEMSNWLTEIASWAPNNFSDQLDGFLVVGTYIEKHPIPPWVRTNMHQPMPRLDSLTAWAESRREGDEVINLGLAAVLAVGSELSGRRMLRRLTLAEAGIPSSFKTLFRNWAKNKVNFVEVRGEDPGLGYVR